METLQIKNLWKFSLFPDAFSLFQPWRKVERQVKVLIKNLSIFYLCPSKQFLPISFQIQLLEYFPEKQKEQRHKQLGYTDKLVTTQI
jgi:hypothetical protein